MKFLVPLMILSCLFLFQYCKTTTYTPENYPARQIVFGSGGGFAGTYNHFYLFENGELYKNSSTDAAYKKVKKLKKQQVAQLFNNYEKMGLKDYKINDPGNMSFYVEFKIGDNNHKMLWGGTNETVDPNVKTIYSILTRFTKVEK